MRVLLNLFLLNLFLNLFWHESAHAKLGVFNALHHRGGLAQENLEFGDKGIAPESRGTWLTYKNTTDMANWLNNEKSMWGGGFDHAKTNGKLVLDSPF